MLLPIYLQGNRKPGRPGTCLEISAGRNRTPDWPAHDLVILPTGYPDHSTKPSTQTDITVGPITQYLVGYFHNLLQVTDFFWGAEDCKVANLVMQGDSRGIINNFVVEIIGYCEKKFM